MANEQCVVRFLLVCLVGFMVLLISNIIGPFEGVAYRFISVIILACILLMVVAYACKRIYKRCRQNRTARCRDEPERRERQVTVPEEELLNIFPELRRHSFPSQGQSQGEPYTVLSVVAEEDEEEAAEEERTREEIVESSNLLTRIEEVEEEEEEDDDEPEPEPDPPGPDEVVELWPHNSGSSRTTSVNSFETAIMDSDIPPPYDSMLPPYTEVITPVVVDRSTL